MGGRFVMNSPSIFKEVVNQPQGISEQIEISYTDFAIGIWHFQRCFKSNELKAIELKGLYREGVLNELHDLGFCKRELAINADGLPFTHPIYVQENRISLVRNIDIQDAFYRSCIEELAEPIIIQEVGKKFIFNAKELIDRYLKQFFLIFNDSFLYHLKSHTLPILEDTEKESYFFFENIIIKTSSTGYEEIKYNELENECVWDDHIIKREFQFDDGYHGCHMDKFISNVSNNEEDRKEAFYCAIGYLLNNYNTETRGQAIICYDESPSQKGEPMGGTGKGLFAGAIKQLRSMTKIDGKKYRSDDKFKWQNVKPTTQVAFLDDVHQKFSFDDLHSLLTDGMNVEKKHKDEIIIPPIKTPKFILTSNTILNGKGTTNERRQFIIEFSDHYSKGIRKNDGTNLKAEPIKEEHGCIFFSNEYWDQSEWNKFFSFMISCNNFYLKEGLKGYNLRNVAKNTFMQATDENFVEWTEDNLWLKEGEKRKLKEVFDDFRETYCGAESDFSQGTFTRWLKIYAESLAMERKISGSNKNKDLQFIHKEERRKMI